MVHDKSVIEEKALHHFSEPELKDGKVIGTSGLLIDTKPDLYRDICTKACLKDMVAQLTSRTFTMDLEHGSFRGKTEIDKQLNKATIPISKIVEAKYVETKDGHAKVQIKDRLNQHHARYNEVEGSIRDNYLNAYSIAFVPQKYEMKSVDGLEYRVLHKVGMLNVAHTGVPVNPRSERESVELKARDENDKVFSEFAQMEPSEASQTNTGLAIEAKARNSEESKMSEETKTNPGAPAEDANFKSQLAELEKRVVATEASNSALAAELKALKDEKDKSNVVVEAEVKALKEKDEMIAQLKAKVEEHDKFLSQPNFKARVDQLAATMAIGQNGSKVETKSKEKSPMDFIQ